MIHPLSKPSFDRYGAKGISICDSWRLFENFFADMGERPSGTTLDRKQSTGNYSPENCRWATAKQQQNNISTNRTVIYKGLAYTARELSDLTGVPYGRLRHRLFRFEWDVERAVSEKPQSGRVTEKELFFKMKEAA